MRLGRPVASLVVTSVLVLTGCSGDGGGGQLAEQAPRSTTTTTRVPGAPIPAHELPGPETPRAVARVLTRVETALRDDERDPDAVPTLGLRQQLAYRALAAHPEWVPHVLAAVPPRLRSVVEANVAADAALGELTAASTPPTELPDWEIHPPKPIETLRSYYAEAEAASGIPWAYLAAIHLVETRMGRIRGASSAGAQGPMQFIPETWEAYGEGSVHDDRDAILAAARYLDDRGGPEDMDRALFAYNNDTRYVAAVRAYASVMLADPRAYDGYHGWQVFFAKADGTVLLPEGYGTG